MGKTLTNVGDVYDTSFGRCEVIEVVGNGRVRVRFKATGYETIAVAGNVRKGLVKDLMAPSASGVGYLGGTEYKCRENGRMTRAYSAWEAMMSRCYAPTTDETARNYEDCSVTPEWHNYQNFAQWFYSQKGAGEVGMSLDKDLLVKGNRVYAPENCCIIPLHANTALTGAKHTNTLGYPCVERSLNRFVARITMNSKGVYLGSFDTVEAAHLVAKTTKESYIHSLAEVYKDAIEPKAYEALKDWRAD